MPEENTLFHKILTGEIPSDKVYEDEHIYAFLDINPVNIGHTLVIPKKFSRTLLEADEETIAHLFNGVTKIARGVKEATKADGINIMNNSEASAGQEIFYTHIHIVPRFDGDGFTHWKGARKYNSGEEQEVVKKIKKEL
ncbi:HIT family protein [Candidatus Wolfebacteria bacterium]|nr:MAG: HIT family protein [Candidatus Wolfebacteria bacterium]